VPALLLLCCLVIALDARGGKRARQAFTVALVMVALSGLGVVSARSDGPSWTAGVQAARTACAQGADRATVRIAPVQPRWTVRLDCSRLAGR
jgi:hypothetical protein